MKTKIVSIDNITEEGVMIYLNKKAKITKEGMSCSKFWVSWDAISEALFKEDKDKK